MLSGGGNSNRYATGIKENGVYTDGLYISCIAIQDSLGNKALIISQDTINSNMFSSARMAIHEIYGTKQSTMPIMFAATHTHSSFNFTTGTDAAGNSLYDTYYLPALKEAVAGALADLAPATMEMGETTAVTADGKPLTAVRRYLVGKGLFGLGGETYGNENQGTIKAKLYEAFDQLQVLRFRRAYKPDVIMSSLGVHATMTGSTSSLYASADWPGAVRHYVETNDTTMLGKDCYYVPFISGAGDQTGESKLNEHGLNYVQYGKAVSDLILAQLKTGEMRKLNSGKLIAGSTYKSYTSSRLVIAFGKDDAQNAAITALIRSYVQDIQEYFNDPNNDFATSDDYAIAQGKALKREISRTYDVLLPTELQFQGYYHAYAIGKRLAKTNDTQSIGLNALRMGDLALTFHSYELFGTSAQWLITGKSNATNPATKALTNEERTPSPFGENTFVVSHANGANGYIPHEEAYSYNCYESYISNVDKTVEKNLHNDMIDILEGLFSEY